MNIYVLLLVCATYLYILFEIARKFEHKVKAAWLRGWIYALSIGVYCTSWTYYGSVGRSVKTGLGFLPIYVGPILLFVFGNGLLRKLLRVAKEQNITSISDLISSRYGKSHAVATIVAIICLIGILPYIALQLEAITNTFNLILAYPAVKVAAAHNPNIFTDTTFYIAILIGLFVIAFGTRSVQATEQHEGIVAAIAFESIVKLAAFLTVGCFVTFALFGGFDHLFASAAADAKLAPLLDFRSQLMKVDFWALSFLSAMAIFCLPRQFQVIVVENTDQNHMKLARWVFPLFLAAINIFVLPLALAGQLLLASKGANPDTYVLTLPVSSGNIVLSVFAFIGGLSAATSMIAVEAIALSTMVCNDLVMPALFRFGVINLEKTKDLNGIIKAIRRVAILLIVLMGCAYSKTLGGSYALVSIGLLSFVAAAQFAPAMVMGLYWKRGTRLGALAGLSFGFLFWLYTLLLPSFAKSGWLPLHFIDQGLLGLNFLRPYALFGLSGMDSITHGLFWSLLANTAAYLCVSLLTSHTAQEAAQAIAFVDGAHIADAQKDAAQPQQPVLPHPAQQAVAATDTSPAATTSLESGTYTKAKTNQPVAVEHVLLSGVTLEDLALLLERFVGSSEKATTIFKKWAAEHGDVDLSAPADLRSLKFLETQLASIVGGAQTSSVVKSLSQDGQYSMWLTSTKLLGGLKSNTKINTPPPPN